MVFVRKRRDKPAKGPHKGGEPSAEDLEGRAGTKENVVGRARDRAQRRNNRVPGAGRRAEGVINTEVRVVSVALSAAELREVKDSQLCRVEKDFVAFSLLILRATIIAISRACS